MTPFEVYLEYCALKAHFTTNYDYFKYGGKMKINPETFEKRKDKYFFHRLSKTFKDKEIRNFLLANIIDSNETEWIGNMDISRESQTTYIKWKRKIEALSVVFDDEFTEILEWCDCRDISKDDLFLIINHNHPLILKMLICGAISIETFIIMNDILKFFPYFNEKLHNDLLWNEYHNKAVKYKKFLKIDKEKCKEIMKMRINTCCNDNHLVLSYKKQKQGK